ncbi:626_t:CDS:2 [Funneliformis mosseae]|uniref:argininosuccinate synthase n=1 Tax=Funneliformis mosseae TaxID=27381 RepID=A0A9N8ZS24_FUNMO|nr:626_t:CDS:2 [Funneliformis mosseae]
MVIKKNLKEENKELKQSKEKADEEIQLLHSLIWKENDSKDLNKLRELLAGQKITEILAELEDRRKNIQYLNFELSKREIIIETQEKEIKSKKETIKVLEEKIKEHEKVTQAKIKEREEVAKATQIKQQEEQIKTQAAGILEDPNVTPPKDMWKLNVDPEEAPNTPERITFKHGILTKVVNNHDNRFSRSLYTVLPELILLKNRFIVIKIRSFMKHPEYFSPEREFLSASLTSSQNSVNREVKLKLYKVMLVIDDRKSDTEKLYDMEESSMDVQVRFIPVGSEGFIKIQSIRLKKWGASENLL